MAPLFWSGTSGHRMIGNSSIGSWIFFGALQFSLATPMLQITFGPTCRLMIDNQSFIAEAITTLCHWLTFSIF